MDISIGTNMLECGPEWRLAREHLAVLAQAGATHVDMHMGAIYEPCGGSFPLTAAKRFVDWTGPEHRQQIAAWLGELGLTAIGLHSSLMARIDLASPDERVRHLAVHDLTQQVALASDLGVTTVVVHVGGDVGEPQRETCMGHLRHSLAQVMPELNRRGVRLACENLPHAGLFADGPGLAQFVTDLDSPCVGLCLDTGHAQLAGWRPVDAVRLAGRKLYMLHVHDNHGQRDEHLPPFAGTIDWVGLVDALGEVGYGGTINLEVRNVMERDDITPVGGVREALDAAVRLLG